MVVTPTIAKEIEEGRTGNLYGLMAKDKQEGGYWGMQTMNQSLEEYARQDLITPDVALRASTNPSEMRHILHRVLEEKRRKAEEAQRQQQRAALLRSPQQGGASP
jgi:twitching motility protein PilT